MYLDAVKRELGFLFSFFFPPFFLLLLLSFLAVSGLIFSGFVLKFPDKRFEHFFVLVVY
jgi:hypothetical protein